MLTDRQNKTLKIIIEKYIKEPVPVGSKSISKQLKCSSATVRNDMMALENMGLLEKKVGSIDDVVERLVAFCSKYPDIWKNRSNLNKRRTYNVQ